MDPNTMEMLRRMASGEPMRPTYAKDKFIDRSFLINMHEDALSSHDFRQQLNQFRINNTTTTALQSSVSVKLIPENQIYISTLFESIDKVHTGKFIICRTIAPPFKMTALATIVDEPQTNLAMRASFYNFAPNVEGCSIEQSAEILPVGTFLIVKNPWFKTTMDGGLSLRCDNPGDLEILEEYELQKLIPGLKWIEDIPSIYKKFIRKSSSNSSTNGEKNGIDWKRLGNEHFVSKRYIDAIKAYSAGIETNNPTNNIDLISNRAACYLNIGKFEAALEDAEEVLKVQPRHIKAIFRKTKALLGMKSFEIAQEFLKLKVSPMLPKEKEVKDLIIKTNMFISQSKHGKYPVKDIADINKEVLQPLDWADYEGAVKVKNTGDVRGRGLFATKYISAGQLILASKAFGFVIKDDRGDFRDMLLSSNLETKLVSDASQVQLVSQLAHSIRDNPDKGKILYKLYAGPKLQYLDPEKDDCSMVDMKRIDGICTYNSFGHGSAFDFKTRRLCGMWITPSFINHSCIDCNCFWTIHGDFLFVRAYKDIKENEEITISYANLFDSYEKRQQAMQKFGFVCNCTLCTMDRNEVEDVKKEKAELLKKINSFEVMTNKDAKILQTWINRLRELRPEYNFLIITPLDKLCVYYSQQSTNNDVTKLLECIELSFSILKGTALCSFAFRLSVQLVEVMLEAGQKKKARKWIGIMKQAAEISYGSLEVFNIFPNFLERLKLNGIKI